MKKILALLLLIFITNITMADGYNGGGIGLSEACRTKSQPSFSGGDCLSPNLNFRGLIGREFSDYFSLEGSLDVSIDPGTALGAIIGRRNQDSFFYDPDVQNDRWTIITLGLHAFAYLPITNSFRLVAGPSVAGSMVDFNYDYTGVGGDKNESGSATQFGLNYGWAAGIDFLKDQRGLMRLQWQNWRSMDADIAYDGEFNTNTLTLNWISYF